MELLIEKATFIEKKNSTLTQDDKALLVKFKLMSAETKNENDRLYPRAVLSKAVEDLKARLAKRKASFAMNLHKDDENVDDVSAVLEDVTMEGNDVMAVAKILPTQRGRNVQSILRHGGAVGVSAKCYGAVKDGIVQPGVVLKGFDFCLSPGFQTFVGKSNIIESVTVEDEDENAQAIREAKGYPTLEALEKGKEAEEARLEKVAALEAEILLQKRYNLARAAGYRGTLKQFAKEPAVVPDRYAFVKEAGYKGNEEQYSKTVLKKKG